MVASSVYTLVHKSNSKEITDRELHLFIFIDSDYDSEYNDRNYGRNVENKRSELSCTSLTCVCDRLSLLVTFRIQLQKALYTKSDNISASTNSPFRSTKLQIPTPGKNHCYQLFSLLFICDLDTDEKSHEN